MCSKRCANPVRPGFSFFEPTWYQISACTIGVEWSSRKTTCRPFGQRRHRVIRASAAGLPRRVERIDGEEATAAAHDRQRRHRVRRVEVMSLDYGRTKREVRPSRRLRLRAPRSAVRGQPRSLRSSGSLRKTADDFSQSRLAMAGIAGNERPRLDRIGNAGLRGRDHALADRQVTGDADLPGERHAVLDDACCRRCRPARRAARCVRA